MINPYEPTAMHSRRERRSWQYAIVLVAGIVGYCAPFGALALMAWFTYGWPVAVQNLERVVNIHRALSLNTIFAFFPNVVLAIFLAKATIKWFDSDDSQRRWWVLGGATFVGYVVVLFSVRYWPLMTILWSSELNNAVRAVLTLMFPVCTHLLAALSGRRSKERAEFAESVEPADNSPSATR
jgi:hypothetical protein